MPRPRLTTFGLLRAIGAAVAVVLMLSGTADVDARRPLRAACPQADIQSIDLGAPAAIDGVRVVVSRRSPVGGAALVRVDAGETDRVVKVRGTLSKVLQFSPPITASELDVSLDPVLSAPRGACVERIDLLSNGHAVASVRPE